MHVAHYRTSIRRNGPTAQFRTPFLISVVLLLTTSLGAQSSVLVHSHNDYHQPFPLIDALAAGCASVEIDILLRGDTLYVAHEEETIESSRTLERLYLTPLQSMLSLGSIQGPLVLLLDLKTSAEPTLRAMIGQLEKFPIILQAESEGQLQLVVSGNRPPPAQYSSYPDYITFDHQALEVLDKKALEKVAMISLSFSKIYSWKGQKRLAKRKKKQLSRMVEFAHEQNKPFRFWGTPDTPLAWETLYEIGVDYINTDHIQECTAYFVE